MVVVRFHVCWLAVVACLWSVGLRAGEIDVHADRNPVALNESFRLTFESHSAVDGEPDFSALNQDFEILGTSKRSNLSFVNGDMERSETWILNVMAKRAGELQVPAVAFGRDRSPPLTIRVEAARPPPRGRSGEDLFLEVEASPKDPYVQAQVLYTVRVFLSVDLNDASLADPSVSGGDAVVELLGDDKHYAVNRDGKRWRVIERRYAIFPQSSGELSIDPLEFEGQIVKGSRSLFDPFGQTIMTKRLRSDAVALHVRAIPDAFRGNTWLPAKQLELREVWSDDTDSLKLGEAVERNIAIMADGLTAGQLPEIAMAVPDAFRQYPEQPTLTDQKRDDGIIGVRQEKLALVAAKSGEFVIPEITVPWWNIKTGKLETAHLPARTIQVAGGAAPAGTTAPGDTSAEAAQRPVKQTPPPATGQARWRLLALGVGALWLITLLVWWWSARRRAGRRPASGAGKTVGSRAPSLSRIRRLALNGEAQALKAALLDWGRQRWPQDPPRNLADIGARCGEPVRSETERLNRTLYGRSDAHFDATALVEGLAAFQERDSSPASPPRTELQALHPPAP